MSIESEVSQGAHATRLMEEIKPYIDMVKVAIIEKWGNSPIADKEGQHELRLMLKLLVDLEANIKTSIETGKMAQIQLEQSFKQKVTSFIKR